MIVRYYSGKNAQGRAVKTREEVLPDPPRRPDLPARSLLVKLRAGTATPAEVQAALAFILKEAAPDVDS